MKKQLISVCAAALIAMGVTGCETKGTIEGDVCDAFTGKPLEMPTVWMDSTVFSTLKEKYPFKQELRKGHFKFEKVPVGTYKMLAGRSKYIKSRNIVTTTEEKPDLNVTLYIYSDQIDPGLYLGEEAGPRKISNEWVIWSTQCDESVAGYRLAFPQNNDNGKVPAKPKKPKKGKAAKKANVKMTPLPEARVMDGKLTVFYRNASSVTTPLVAKTYAAVEGLVSEHPDCKGFDGDEKGLFVDKSKSTDLTVTYMAENLFKITGDLPKGKQIIQFSQDGKTLQTYYFEVK